MSLSIITWNAQGDAREYLSTLLAINDHAKPEVILIQEAGVDFKINEKIGIGTKDRPVSSYVVASQVPTIGAKNDRCTNIILVKSGITYTKKDFSKSSTSARPVECVLVNNSYYIMSIHAVASDDATVELISVLRGFSGDLSGKDWILGGDFNASPAETSAAIAGHARKEPFFQNICVSSSGKGTQIKGGELDYFIHSPNPKVTVSLLKNPKSDHWPVLGVFS